jgi:hypothetical protein
MVMQEACQFAFAAVFGGLLEIDRLFQREKCAKSGLIPDEWKILTWVSGVARNFIHHPREGGDPARSCTVGGKLDSRLRGNDGEGERRKLCVSSLPQIP